MRVCARQFWNWQQHCLVTGAAFNQRCLGGGCSRPIAQVTVSTIKGVRCPGMARPQVVEVIKVGAKVAVPSATHAQVYHWVTASARS